MPDTAVDHPTIQEAFNNGEINKAGYDILTKQLDDLATPEGFELATMKRGYVGAFKPVVDPNSLGANTEAAAQTIQLEKSLSQKIDDMRASGKDPRDLFDPSTPDYKSPFDLARNYVPGAQGASLLQAPQSQPTEPERVDEGPQAPPNNLQSSIDGANSTLVSKDNAPLDGNPAKRPDDEGSMAAFERAAQATRRSVLERHEGAGTDFFNRFMASNPEALKAWLEKGREVFGPPPAPAKPGFWSEEDEIRRQEFEQKKIEFAVDTAMMLLFRGKDRRWPPPKKPSVPEAPTLNVDGLPRRPNIVGPRPDLPGDPEPSAVAGGEPAATTTNPPSAKSLPTRTGATDPPNPEQVTTAAPIRRFQVQLQIRPPQDPPAPRRTQSRSKNLPNQSMKQHFRDSSALIDIERSSLPFTRTSKVTSMFTMLFQSSFLRSTATSSR
jgi:hypothetical protein